MILLLDENMPRQVAVALNALGDCEAHHLLEFLPAGTVDEEVFKFLGERSWVLLTQDYKITRRPLQVKALVQSGVGAFFLTGRAERSHRELHIFVLERLPKILELAERTKPPYIFGVPDRGKIARLDK